MICWETLLWMTYTTYLNNTPKGRTHPTPSGMWTTTTIIQEWFMDYKKEHKTAIWNPNPIKIHGIWRNHHIRPKGSSANVLWPGASGHPAHFLPGQRWLWHEIQFFTPIFKCLDSLFLCLSKYVNVKTLPDGLQCVTSLLEMYFDLNRKLVQWNKNNKVISVEILSLQLYFHCRCFVFTSWSDKSSFGSVWSQTKEPSGSNLLHCTGSCLLIAWMKPSTDFRVNQFSERKNNIFPEN